MKNEIISYLKKEVFKELKENQWEKDFIAIYYIPTYKRIWVSFMGHSLPFADSITLDHFKIVLANLPDIKKPQSKKAVLKPKVEKEETKKEEEKPIG